MNAVTHINNQIIDDLRAFPEQTLKKLYTDHYQNVCFTVYKMIKDSNVAEDIAQEVFYEIWKKRDRIEISTSIGAYLRRAAINRTLNYLRSKKVDFDEEDAVVQMVDETPTTQSELEAQDLKQVIDEAIDGLPEKCRVVFALSRFENLTYKEIATKLDISTKTVENQISKAIKILKNAVNKYRWIEI